MFADHPLPQIFTISYIGVKFMMPSLISAAMLLLQPCMGVEFVRRQMVASVGSYADLHLGSQTSNTSDPTCPINYIGTLDCTDDVLQSSQTDCERFYEEINRESFACKWEGGACIKGAKCTLSPAAMAAAMSGAATACTDVDFAAPSNFGGISGAWVNNGVGQEPIEYLASDGSGNFIAAFVDRGDAANPVLKAVKFTPQGTAIEKSGRYITGGAPTDAAAFVQRYNSCTSSTCTSAENNYVFNKGAGFACAA